MDTTRIGAEELLAHSRWLRGLAAALVGDAAAADDLVQETWLRALRHPPRGGRPVRPWLARLARNLARSEKRGERIRAGHERALEAPPPERASDEVVEEIEAQSLVVQALLALDEPLRTALALRYFRGLDSPEIARLTGSSPSTVRWRIQRGLEELRARLDRRFHGKRGAWIALLAPLGRLAEMERIAGATLPVGGAKVAQAIGVAALALVLAGWLGWAVFWRAPRAEGAGVAGKAPATPVAPLATGPSAAPVRAAEPDARTAVAATAPHESPPIGPTDPNALVELRCVDLFGRALAGVQIVEEASLRGLGESGMDGLVLCTVPAPDGERSWSARLVATKPGHAARPLRAVLHAGTTTNLGEIVLEEGGAVAGRVLDPAGRAVAGARVGTMEVELRPERAQYLRLRGPKSKARPLETTTDVQGRFQLDGLPAGPAQVWSKGADTTYGFSAVVDVPVARVVRDVELVLDPFAREERIRGIVLDPQGQPVPHAELGVSYRHGGERAEAGADGRFELVVDLQSPSTITAQDPERRFSAATRRDVQPGADDVMLQLRDPPRIELLVVNPAGQPVEHYGLFSGSGTPGPIVPWAASFEHPGGRSSLGVPDSTSTFIVRANGYAPFELGPWATGDLPRELTVALEPSVPGALLRGRVVAGGVPVTGAEVALFPSAPEGQAVYADDVRCKFRPFEAVRATTDAEGRFLLAFERAGAFWVRAVGEGRAPALAGPLHLDPAQPAEELELALTIGGVIEGRVAAARGVEPAGTIVLANCGDGLPRSQRAGWGGTFRFERLAPGPWHVSVAGEDVWPEIMSTSVTDADGPLEWNCTVADEQTTYLELALPVAETCVLAGRLVLGDTDLSGWLASLRSLDYPRQEHLARAHSALGRDGSFRMEVSVAGHYELLLIGPAGPDTSLRLVETLELAAGEQMWHAALHFGRVQGVVGPETMSSSPRLTCTSTPRAGLACSAPIRLDPAGRFVLVFPAGRVSITDEAHGHPIVLELVPGGQVETRLP